MIEGDPRFGLSERDDGEDEPKFELIDGLDLTLIPPELIPPPKLIPRGGAANVGAAMAPINVMAKANFVANFNMVQNSWKLGFVERNPRSCFVPSQAKLLGSKLSRR
jgi:hypothetical protein